LKYTAHIENIKTHFPKLDLLTEKEFYNFKNEKFAISLIEYCVNLCENVSKQLNIELKFGVLYNYTFNASAKLLNGNGVITFNLGLIDRLESIISETIELFLMENISSMTIPKDQRKELEKLSFESCVAYICNHELAHIIQFSDKSNDYQELYTEETKFNIKNHIYEFDADLFGCIVSTYMLVGTVRDENNNFKTIDLYNYMTLLLLLIANIIIEFSGKTFKDIYYKENKHPHPFIRIIKCKEQILGNILNNTKIPRPFFESALDRAIKIIGQLLYTGKRTVNYSELYTENLAKISSYVTEIENENIKYNELTRHKSQEFIRSLF
jgi:hypothetical protein